MKANELKQDARNYRKHSERNKELIRKSVDECGFGRSVVMDADGVLIGGNGVAMAAGDAPVRVIETDGSELVVVKRTDLHTGDEKRRLLALADNATSDSSAGDWDTQAMDEDWDRAQLDEWGVADWGGVSLDEDGNYQQVEQEQSIYEAPPQLFPSQEYILIICERDEFDDARAHFGLGFVANTLSRNAKDRAVKCRTIKWADYVSSNTKQEQTLEK